VFILFSIVILHELGHILSCIIFKRKINKISIFPFGAFMKYEEDDNTFLYKELIIASSGILVNILLYIIFKVFDFKDYFIILNNYVLFFNILIIYPLDGGRILEIILCFFYEFKSAVFITILVSLIMLVILFILDTIMLKSLNLGFILIYLIFENIKYFKNRKIRFKQFLLKKFLNENKDLKEKKIVIKKINLFDNFFKGKNNFLMIKNKKKTEKELLSNLYMY
jgi:stage IV sporulation protein FB